MIRFLLSFPFPPTLIFYFSRNVSIPAGGHIIQGNREYVNPHIHEYSTQPALFNIAITLFVL